MMSAFCRVPCRRLRYADACINKGEVTALMDGLRMTLHSRGYGLCQSVPYEDMGAGHAEMDRKRVCFLFG
jgi:hypothetical protein